MQRSGCPIRDLFRPVVVHVVAATLICATTAQAQSLPLDTRVVETSADLLAVHDARSADTTVIDHALRSHDVTLRAAAIRVVGMWTIGSCAASSSRDSTDIRRRSSVRRNVGRAGSRSTGYERR